MTAATKTEAARKLGRLRYANAAVQEQDGRVTVATILLDWRDLALPNKSLAPSTLQSHQWAVNLLLPVIGTRQAAGLVARDIEKALTTIGEERHLSRASFVKIRSTMNQAMEWAVKRRTIAHNPVTGVELPTATPGPRDRRALSRDEATRLLAVLEGKPHEAMYLLMLLLGLRPGEAAGVCVDVVDLDAGTVAVARAIQADEHGRPTLTDDLKTQASFRKLFLPDRVRSALATHIDISGAAGDDLLFTAPRGGPLWPSTVRAELVELCQAAGVTPMRPVELRHTFVTLAAEELPPHQVADILGHTTTRMLETNYRHRPPVVGGAAVNLLT